MPFVSAINFSIFESGTLAEVFAIVLTHLTVMVVLGTIYRTTVFF